MRKSEYFLKLSSSKNLSVKKSNKKVPPGLMLNLNLFLKESGLFWTNCCDPLFPMHSKHCICLLSPFTSATGRIFPRTLFHPSRRRGPWQTHSHSRTCTSDRRTSVPEQPQSGSRRRCSSVERHQRVNAFEDSHYKNIL